MKAKFTENENGILGIDAGGTFTDIVFMSGERLKVRVKAKDAYGS